MREVCRDELPWRAQASIHLAQCYLDLLLERVAGGREEKGGGGEKDGRQLPPSYLRLEGAGVVIRGVIPTYLPTTPGYNVS